MKDQESVVKGQIKTSEGIVFVREYCGTYIARFRGKRASSTSSSKFAAQAVARKVMGNEPHFVEICGNDKAWQVISTKEKPNV